MAGPEEVHEPVATDDVRAQAARVLDGARLRPLDAVEELASGCEPGERDGGLGQGQAV
jgi:hypothetical protein